MKGALIENISCYTISCNYFKYINSLTYLKENDCTENYIYIYNELLYIYIIMNCSLYIHARRKYNDH